MFLERIFNVFGRKLSLFPMSNPFDKRIYFFLDFFKNLHRMSLPQKDNFLQSLEELSYHERIHKAHQFGRDNKDSPDLVEWVKEMRKVRTLLYWRNIILAS